MLFSCATSAFLNKQICTQGGKYPCIDWQAQVVDSWQTIPDIFLYSLFSSKTSINGVQCTLRSTCNLHSFPSGKTRVCEIFQISPGMSLIFSWRTLKGVCG